MSTDADQSIRSLIHKNYDLKEGEVDLVMQRLQCMAGGGDPLDWMWWKCIQGFQNRRKPDTVLP